MLAGAIFAGVAMLRGPHWQLMPGEQASIADAAADLLESMPDSAAEKSAEVLEKFSAPFALASALGTAVISRVMLEQQHMAKLRALQAQAQQQQQPTPTPTGGNTDVPSTPQPAPAPQPSARKGSEFDSQLLSSSSVL